MMFVGELVEERRCVCTATCALQRCGRALWGLCGTPCSNCLLCCFKRGVGGAAQCSLGRWTCSPEPPLRQEACTQTILPLPPVQSSYTTGGLQLPSPDTLPHVQQPPHRDRALAQVEADDTLQGVLQQVVLAAAALVALLGCSLLLLPALLGCSCSCGHTQQMQHQQTQRLGAAV